MKKILLMLLCLLTLLVFASVAFASGDVDHIANNDSIQISDNPNVDIAIPTDMPSPDNTTTDEAVNVGPANQTIKSDAFTGNESSKNTPELNITGPKINGTNLDIKGPKISKDGPKITISQMDKDIYHFAKVFMEHPHWDLYDCIDYVRFHSPYHWHEISIIVAKAHNIALHKYKGDEIMILGWEVTPESVEYRSQNFYGWK